MGRSMRLPNTAHACRPWRVHELAGDFRLEDVWGLPTPGGPDDFPRLVRLMASLDPSQSSGVVRVLFAIRRKVGELLGWDHPQAGVESSVPTLRDRLPADLCGATSGPTPEELPFSSLYLTEDEWALELANQTVHGVLHVGLGSRWRGRPPRPDGRAREAERTARKPLHGRHHPVPPLDRLPADDAADRTGVAGEPRRADARSRVGARVAQLTLLDRARAACE